MWSQKAIFTPQNTDTCNETLEVVNVIKLSYNDMNRLYFTQYAGPYHATVQQNIHKVVGEIELTF